MTEPSFRTISEVSALVGVPHHVLRFWETRFAAIAPLKRGGNRRYYRPSDVAAVERVARLLHVEGYTIKGAQKLFEAESAGQPAPASAATAPVAVPTQAQAGPDPVRTGFHAAPDPARTSPLAAIAALRADLAAALAAARAL